MKKVSTILLFVFAVMLAGESRAGGSQNVADNVVCSETCVDRAEDVPGCMFLAHPLAQNICAYATGYLEACFPDPSIRALYIEYTMILPLLHAEIASIILDQCSDSGSQDDGSSDDSSDDSNTGKPVYRKGGVLYFDLPPSIQYKPMSKEMRKQLLREIGNR